MTTEIFKKAAVGNAISSIRRERRFPRQVFAGAWAGYLFFYPDVLFEAGFIEVKNLLLKEESASIIAVVNLGNAGNKAEEQPPAVFLDRDTGADDYVAELMGDGSPTSWMFLMDRYVIASDRGHWSIYCEKENDVAVMAIGEAVSGFTRSRLTELLSAGRLFDFPRLVPEWRSALMAEYHS